jgi:SAM-dependent methyltransferase
MTFDSDYDVFADKRATEFAANKNFTHTYIEKPAMYALLPDLTNKDVLCVGCGTGEECTELTKRGAHVIGFDSSSASIEYARRHVAGVTLSVADMDDPVSFDSYGPEQFDLVYSSLTLHYSDDLEALLTRLYVLLKPAGSLIFSVGHPLRWAAEVTKNDDSTSVLMGYAKKADGTIQTFGDYLDTRQFTQQLSDGPEVTYWMRPISNYFDLLDKAGFTITTFKEPAPVPEAEAADKHLYALRTKMPVDMIFVAQKQAS